MSTVVSPRGSGTAAAPAGGRARRRRGKPLPYLLLVPAVAAMAVAMAYPLGRQVLMSFQEYGLAQQFGAPARWVGLANYRDLVTDATLWAVIGRSVAFCLANVTLTMGLGVGVALLMTQLSAPVRIAVQVSLLLAWAMPVLAALTVWQWMFDTRYGVVNHVLSAGLGLPMARHSWLIDPLSFFAVATVVVVWMSIPFVAFTTYAGLTQVPEESVEAATLDGADAQQRLRYVVLPAITPVLSVVALLQVVWDLRVFTQIYVLQGAGGISSQTNLLGTYVYRLGIAEGNFGASAAVAIFLLVLTMGLTFGYVRSMIRQEDR